MGTIIHFPNMVQRRSPVPASRRGSKAQDGNDGVKIGLLIFRCPVTARDIESGIEMDSQTFRWVRHLGAGLHCRACHCTHELTVADGTLASYGGARYPNWRPAATRHRLEAKMLTRRRHMEIPSNVREHPGVSAEGPGVHEFIKRIANWRYRGERGGANVDGAAPSQSIVEI